jgi:hypothetical protein
LQFSSHRFPSHQCAALQVTAVQSPSSPGLRGSGLLPYNYFHCTSILRRAIHHTAPQCAPHQCAAPHLRGFSLPDATVQPLQFIAGRFISQQGIAFQTHSKAIQFTGFMVPVATVQLLPLHFTALRSRALHYRAVQCRSVRRVASYCRLLP